MSPLDDREAQVQTTILSGQLELNPILVYFKFPRIERGFCRSGVNAGRKFHLPGQEEDILYCSNRKFPFSANHFRNKQKKRN
jgi:hypothetical protein